MLLHSANSHSRNIKIGLKCQCQNHYSFVLLSILKIHKKCSSSEYELNFIRKTLVRKEIRKEL